MILLLKRILWWLKFCTIPMTDRQLNYPRQESKQDQKLDQESDSKE